MMATPPPQSLESVSINSRDRLNFDDLYTIFYECGAQIVEQKLEVEHLEEEMGRDLVISKVDLLALHCRLEQTGKKLHSITVFVVGLVFAIFGFLVANVVNVLKK
ncbi:unnamed protein product [Lactuca saligna]|uniref:Uncharacterized protein n=1 Tax=Lactuca saligna TaxID=75948 RepID=A0AA35ZIG8_LACSI|nr:unnamed protein product [Lactuca saligna]